MPRRANTKAVSAARPSDSAKESRVRPSTLSGSLMIEASTPSISATAKKNSATTREAVDALALARDPFGAGETAHQRGDDRGARSSASSLPPSVSGEIAMPGPTNRRGEHRRGERRHRRAHHQRRERERGIEPHQGGERRRGDDRRGGGLQDHRHVEPGQAVGHAEQEQREPDQQRRCQHHPGGGRADDQRAAKNAPAPRPDRRAGRRGTAARTARRRRSA